MADVKFNLCKNCKQDKLLSIPDEDCSICYGKLKNDTPLTRLFCRHVFHYDCYATWSRQCDNLGNEITCPYCRAGACWHGSLCLLCKTVLEARCRMCKDDDICMIITGKCGHVFHWHCIAKQMSRTPYCPSAKCPTYHKHTFEFISRSLPIQTNTEPIFIDITSDPEN